MEGFPTACKFVVLKKRNLTEHGAEDLDGSNILFEPTLADGEAMSPRFIQQSPHLYPRYSLEKARINFFQ